MINLESAVNNLIDIDKVFRKHNISYWLQDGTLLGLYRDKNFISHDDDTDVGLFFSDIETKKNVFSDLFDLGFELYKVKGNIKSSLLVTIIRNNTSTDLFFYYTEKDKIYHSSFKILTTNIGKRSLQINYFYEPFNIKETTFLNNKFFVPEDEEKFLLTKYGPNWRTPIVNWDHLYDPVNAVVTDIMLDNKLSKQQFKEWMIN